MLNKKDWKEAGYNPIDLKNVLGKYILYMIMYNQSIMSNLKECWLLSPEGCNEKKFKSFWLI